VSFERELTEIKAKFELTCKKCPKEVETLKGFVSDITVIFGCIAESADAKKIKNSLTFSRFLQSTLHVNEISLLLMPANYTSGVQILRYYLESVIQAFYLDRRHPCFSIENKICILTETADSREYFVSRLLEKISTARKEDVRMLYKDLSMISHPSHLDFPTVDEMIKYLEDKESKVDCKELIEVVSLMMRTYDAIFFLVLEVFPEIKKTAKEHADVGKVVDRYSLSLLKRTL
jgi:hypothetical protein